MKTIQLHELPKDGLFDGYYWLSSDPENGNKPVLVQNQPLPACLSGALPFVVEAQFYSRELDLGIVIRNIDGKPVCHEIDFKTLAADQLDEYYFVAHLLEVKSIRMVRYWERHSGDLGLKTFRPVWTAFKGFEYHHSKNTTA